MWPYYLLSLFLILLKSRFLLNRTYPFSFVLDEFTENIAIFGHKFSAESTILDIKKLEYITYKGLKILLLIETNIIT
jgi:hypothetical protein